MSNCIKINKKKIGEMYPSYFIADIAANHDGSLNKAIDLINLAKESGADAAKFQHFKAETIVSDHSFKSLKHKKLSHQSKWKKSVFQVYKEAEFNLKWTSILKKECDKIKIDFFTSPYSKELVDHVDKYVPAYKIGSGEITWIEIIKYIAAKKKPYIIATGAANLKDVKRAVSAAYKINKKIAIMQCNTNYTAENNNINYINLNVLKQYKIHFPKAVLGLSDHTLGHTTILGAIMLGAKIFEKHFTINNSHVGPDHKFSMNPNTWRQMILSSRELESAIGNGEKIIENNEKDTVILQRRSIHLKNNISKGTKIKKNDLIYLRPCPKDGIEPYNFKKVVGKKIKKNKKTGELLTIKDVV
tara:strand:- start:3724 stop:4797 length:1074 start_codon:yes stop_codon:yes gene_type:complete